MSFANRSRKYDYGSQKRKKKQRLDDLTQSRKELWIDLLWRNHKNEVVSVNTIQLRLYTILDVFNFYIIYYNMFNILLFYLASILGLTLEFRTGPQFLPARPCDLVQPPCHSCYECHSLMLFPVKVSWEFHAGTVSLFYMIWHWINEERDEMSFHLDEIMYA